MLFDNVLADAPYFGDYSSSYNSKNFRAEILHGNLVSELVIMVTYCTLQKKGHITYIDSKTMIYSFLVSFNVIIEKERTQK